MAPSAIFGNLSAADDTKEKLAQGLATARSELEATRNHLAQTLLEKAEVVRARQDAAAAWAAERQTIFADLAESDARVKRAKRAKENLEGELESVQQRLVAAVGTIFRLEGALEKSRSDATRLQGELHAAERDRDTATAQLRQATRDQDRLRALAAEVARLEGGLVTQTAAARGAAVGQDDHAPQAALCELRKRLEDAAAMHDENAAALERALNVLRTKEEQWDETATAVLALLQAGAISARSTLFWFQRDETTEVLQQAARSVQRTRSTDTVGTESPPTINTPPCSNFALDLVDPTGTRCVHCGHDDTDHVPRCCP